MPKIEALFAFISVDEGPEDEGIVAARMGNMWMPLVGADMDRIDSLRPLAESVARLTGKKIVMAKFSVREDMEEILPLPRSE